MTAPLPPTSGPVSAGDRGGMQGAEQPMDIQAPLQDLSAMAAEAEAAGNAWQAGAGAWADSPQGAGLGGFTLAGDHPAGADGDWPVDMSFPHQGP
jgi:hypothetical protein